MLQDGQTRDPGTETLGFNMKRLDPITIVDGDLRERAGACDLLLPETESEVSAVHKPAPDGLSETTEQILSRTRGASSKLVR